MSAISVPKGSAIEAVIISGPRKGELIRLESNGKTSPPVEQAVERALDEAVRAANEMAANVRGMRRETEAFVAELRRRRRQRESA
jgi:hypothetical protein